MHKFSKVKAREKPTEMKIKRAIIAALLIHKVVTQLFAGTCIQGSKYVFEECHGGEARIEEIKNTIICGECQEDEGVEEVTNLAIAYDMKTLIDAIRTVCSAYAVTRQGIKREYVGQLYLYTMNNYVTNKIERANNVF